MVVRLLLAWLLAGGVLTAGEVRGVWVARDTLGTRAQIRTMMQNLAAANFNAAYVLVWSQGYTLYPSAVFERETGLKIDPQYAGRDVLQEAIEEGRAAGITVFPWAEYGFIGGWSGRRAGPENMGPIFERHPEWVARKKDGDFRYRMADGTSFTWMNHFHPEVQRFLLDLMVEIQEKYDVPGIQFDRARLPELDAGYDEYTKALYAEENEGKAVPEAVGDTGWVRWRANKINAFVGRLHKELKEADWRALVTNAPGLSAFAFVNFAQEYPAWMRAGSLDFVTPQVYRRDVASFVTELNREVGALGGEVKRMVVGVDVTNSGSGEVLGEMIEEVRRRGCAGVVVWYYEGLMRAKALEGLGGGVFREKAVLPFRSTISVDRN